MVRDGTHHTRDIIHHHKGKQCIEQTVTAAQEPAEPAADTRKDKLNRVPEFFHVKFLAFFIFVYEKSDRPKLDRPSAFVFLYVSHRGKDSQAASLQDGNQLHFQASKRRPIPSL